ncbi:unnamed protein product, partial [Enterobius vermicularis]|uniref:Chromo domain-containing protein n=1 Tax=Enterobius vermicularis TaxID=51028 RepID=A0A0N4VB41_ENTVE
MKIFWRTFQVEKIVGYRVQDGKELYRVRWAGFNEEDDTWEPYENLNDACRLMIKDMFGRFPDDLKLDSCKQFIPSIKLRALLWSNQMNFKGLPSKNIEYTDPDYIGNNQTVVTRGRSSCARKSLAKTKKSSSVKRGEVVGKTEGKAGKVGSVKRKQRLQTEKLRRCIRSHVKIANGKIEPCQICDRFPKQKCFSVLKSEGKAKPLRDIHGHSVTESRGEELHPQSEPLEKTVLEVIETQDEGPPNQSAEPEIAVGRNSSASKKSAEESERRRMNEGDSSNSVVDDRSKMEDEFIPDGYAKLPVNKIVGLKLEELEMAIFMSKESVYAAELTNFQVTGIVYDFRSAALQGNVVAVKNCLRQLQNNPIFPIDKKFCGKTLICEMKCDSTHSFDDILQELVRAGARLDI